jgi:hypothetical protein
MAYMAVRAGIPTVILDPSGLLDRLCAVPELSAHACAVNLLTAPPGTLSPYSLIADPRREDFAAGDQGQPAGPGQAAQLWQQACAATAVQRQELAKEILQMLLPAEMRSERSAVVLSKAASMVQATTTASLRDVLAAMRTIGDDYGVGHTGVWLADQLEELTSHPWARLFFPPAGAAGGGDVTAAGRLLTVMTLRGLIAPGPGTPPEQYTTEQRLSVPLMHLAAWLTRRHVMDRPRHTRKLTIIDEAHQVTGGPIGQALVTQTARDSRKHDHTAIFLSQLPQDLQISMVDNLIGMALAGRTDGAAEQAATLRFLGLPAGQGYEAALAALSRGDARGQFMVSDGNGVEVVQVDLTGCSEALRRALDSTPTGQARPAAAVPAPAAAAAGAAYGDGAHGGPYQHRAAS